MKKKLLSLILCLVMVAASVCMLVACDPTDDNGGGGGGGGGGGTVQNYDITVWVGEGNKDLTAAQIAKFNSDNAGVNFNARIEIVSEGKAIGDIEGKPTNSWPDVFCFAQDQLARAVKGNMLHTLNNDSVTAITSGNSADTVEATKIGSTIRAFPMTADNGYYMYYDKRVVKEEHLGSLEDILSDVEGYTDSNGIGRKFAMLLSATGGGWYASSFFYATGCKSEWVTNENGGFTTYEDTFRSDAGVKALQGMQKILKSKAHEDSDKAATFSAAIPSAVVISGIWDYNTAKDALGDNLGIAPLPSFTVGTEKFQLVSYLGHKLVGIKPQGDAVRAYYLQKLVTYLTGAECQLERFKQLGWGPSNTTLQSNSDVLASAALNALAATKTTMQGQYPDAWWADVLVMTQSAKTAGTDFDSLDGILKTYKDQLSGYLS